MLGDCFNYKDERWARTLSGGAFFGVGSINFGWIARAEVEAGGKRHERRGSGDTSPRWAMAREAFLGGSPLFRFLLIEELGDAHQIVGQHCGAHQHLEPLAALGPAPLHSSAAK